MASEPAGPDSPAKDSATATPPRRGYSTRMFMTATAVGVVFGLLLIPANLYSIAVTTTYPLFGAAVWGLWGMAGFVAVGLQRRFGLGILACVVSGLVSGPLSGYGWSLVAMMLLWGVLLEVPFMVTRYRRYSVLVYLTGGLILGLVSVAIGWVPLGLEQMSAGAAAAMIGAALGSCVLGAWLSALAVGRLAAAGLGAAPRSRS